MKFPGRPKKPKESKYTNKCLDCFKSIYKTALRCKPCSKKKEHRNPNVRQKGWAKKINGVYLQSIATRIRDLKEYVQWRADVFKRDYWTCQTCQKRGQLLHAHHIKYLSIILIEYQIDTMEKAITCAELWDLTNGVTLCKPCHKLAHRKRK